MTDGYKIDKGFMWVREPKIPSEYQEVEYIESSGTQYIDTGYKTNRTISTKLKIAQNMSYVSEYAIFGDAWSEQALFLMTYQGYFRYHYSFNGQNVVAATGDIIEIETSNTGIKINGTNYSYTAGSTFSNYNIHIFNSGDNSSPSKRGRFKLYYFKLYDNGTLVRDFVPCYRKSDNIIGMYDMVEGKFYANSGTGTFTKGNDVTPTYIFKEKQFYPGVPPTPPTKETTFTLSDFYAGGGSTRFDNIAVDGNIVEIEFNGTLNCPASSSTWADAQIGFTNSNSGDGFPGVYKTRQIGRNRSYYGDTSNGLSLNLSSSDYLTILYQKTPAATGSYAIKMVVNSEGVVVESGTNTVNHSWTSNESTYYENIISGVSYCRIYGTQMSWTNMTVKVKYV